MADRPRTNSALSTDHRPNGNNNPNNIIRRFHNQAPNSSQIIGLLTLAVSGSVLLLLTGVTVAASVLALLFFMPIILLSSPIWVPLATLFLLASAAFLSLCAFAVAAVAASSWLYRYLKGFNPPGAVRVDYARSRIYDTAAHVKDYAKEYGGYLQSKVKDAAPGA